MKLMEIYQDVVIELDNVGNQVRDHINKSKELFSMEWNVIHNNSVSNTHSCPKDGIKNWHCHRDRPNGYPGWEGRLWLNFKEQYEGFSSDTVQGSLTYVGTGGAGNYNGTCQVGHMFSWDYRFYDSDFPKLEELVGIAKAQQLIYQYHADSYYQRITHRYYWNRSEHS